MSQPPPAVQLYAAKRVCPMRWKRHRRASSRRLHDLIHPVPADARAAGDAQDGKGLSSAYLHAIFTSTGTQLEEYW